MARAQKTFNADELKVFSGVPANDVARRHLHKLMQVTLGFHSLCASICFFFLFFFSFFFIFFKCVSFLFFIQVLGESLHITSEYLAFEAKVESARSHASSIEAENSKLREELIAAMDDANQAKEKLRILTEELRVEQELTKEKDEQIATARQRAKGLAAKAVEGFQ